MLLLNLTAGFRLKPRQSGQPSASRRDQPEEATPRRNGNHCLDLTICVNHVAGSADGAVMVVRLAMAKPASVRAIEQKPGGVCFLILVHAFQTLFRISAILILAAGGAQNRLKPGLRTPLGGSLQGSESRLQAVGNQNENCCSHIDESMELERHIPPEFQDTD